MLAPFSLFPSPSAQPMLGRSLSEGFIENNGIPAFFTMPLGDERAYDLSGNNNPAGTLNGGITTTPGGFGTLGAAWGGFNASSRYISTTYSGVLGTAARWVAVVFSTTSTTGAGTNSLISWGDNTGLTAGTIWDVDVENGVIWLRCGSGVTASWGSGYNDGKFHLLVLTMKSGAPCNQIECSVDGVPLSGTFANGTTAINTASSAAVQIGRMTTNNNYFAGSVALAAIGGSYLLSGTRSQLYNCLFTGEPFPLFAASTLTRFYSLPSSGAFNQSLASGLSFTGSENRLVSKGLSSSLSFTGLQIKQMVKQHLAALSFTGSSKQGSGKGIAGSLSFIGAINKGATNKLTGTLSFTSSVKRGTAKALSGTLSFSGTVIHSVLKTLAATLSFGGSVGRTITYKLAAFLSFAASLSNGHSQQVNLDAVLSFSGNVNRNVSKGVSAALSFTGSAVKNVGKGLSGALGFGGTISRSILKTFTGGLSFSSSLNNGVAKLLLKLRRWLSDE